MKRVIFYLATAAAITLPTTTAFAQHTFPSERSHCRATLTASNPNSRITLRSGAGTNYRSLGYGLAGDNVYVLTATPPEPDYKKDRFGYGWHRVGFPVSGAKGWIREDLLDVECRQIND
ncbi:MAG: hypothetical protein WA919_20170 [Coleofasciculaceae cyanobacterium]